MRSVSIFVGLFGLTLAMTGQGTSMLADTHVTQLSQWPILDEETMVSMGRFPLPSDRACNLAAECPTSQATALAAAGPGMDLYSSLRIFDEIVVWGLYGPGAPPAVDAFTVIVHEWGWPWGIGSAVCAESAIAGTREVVGEVFDKDVYRHTLRLSTSCDRVVPGNHAYWVEVFNDTGPDSDWFWMPGHHDWGWPFDCCTDVHEFGTVVDVAGAPGSEWVPVFQGPLAIEVRALPPGQVRDLRLAKIAADRIRLEWAPDCGGSNFYSVYRGDLSQGYSSTAPEPGLCDVAGTSTAVEAGEGAADFFLVAPWTYYPEFATSPPLNGSFGADSTGALRAVPAERCYGGGFWLHDCAN